MLFRSVDDRMITKMLPNTFKAIGKWDGKDTTRVSQFTKVL